MGGGREGGGRRGGEKGENGRKELGEFVLKGEPFREGRGEVKFTSFTERGKGGRKRGKERKREGRGRGGGKGLV